MKLPANTPVAIKLGLRDLGNNKIATGALIVILGLTIALTLPMLLSRHLEPWNSRLSSVTISGVTFHDGGARTSHAAQLVINGIDLSTGGLDLFTPAGLRPLPGYLDWAGALDYSVPMELEDGTVEQYNPPATAWTAAWTDEDYAAQIAGLDGRLPTAPSEIAISDDFAEHVSLNTTVTQPSIGDVLNIELPQGPTALTVVGQYQAATLPAQALLYSVDPQAMWSTPTGTPMPTYIGLGPALSEPAAEQLITNISELFPHLIWQNWITRNQLESPQFHLNMASTTPFSPAEGPYSPTDSMSFLLPGILGLITLLSIPLYWQNYRRRSKQLGQLARAGAPAGPLWQTQLVPGLVVGLSAATLGFVGGTILHHYTYGQAGNSPQMPISVGNTWLYGLLVSLAAGILPMLVASLLPRVMERLNMRTSRTSPKLKTENEPRTAPQPVDGGLSAPFLFLLAGIGVMSASALVATADTVFAGLALGFTVMIIASYFLVFRIVPRLSAKFSGKELAPRLAARELNQNRAATVNAIMPIATLIGLGAAISVIGRQHQLEPDNDAAAYGNTALLVSLVILALAIFTVFFIALRSTEETRELTTGLELQGVSKEPLQAISGYRSLLITGVAATLGYVLGTAIGIILMVYRGNFESNTYFRPMAALPDVVVVICVVLPVVFSYLLGQLAHSINSKQLTATA